MYRDSSREGLSHLEIVLPPELGLSDELALNWQLYSTIC